MAGSRHNQEQLLDATFNHSCLASATHSSIFLLDKNSKQLHAEHVVKSRKKAGLEIKVKSGHEIKVKAGPEIEVKESQVSKKI